MALDIRSFDNAVSRLEEGLARHLAEAHDSQIRDGLIQRFEFTYELSHKILKRYLVSIAPSPDAYDGLPFADLIRAGRAQGLLSQDWPIWRGFRDMRGTTSHAYDEDKAILIVAAVPDFLREALYLRDQLRQRLT